MAFFTPLLGGVLIGLAAVLLLLANGKIAGVSGIMGGWMRTPARHNFWRIAFLGGLLAGGLLAKLLGGQQFEALAGRSLGAIAAAGLLVGFGTQLGSGCTSGHGVCGIGRLSIRSVVATAVFMAAGMATVALLRLSGGTL